jgi:hypothetical protein
MGLRAAVEYFAYAAYRSALDMIIAVTFEIANIPAKPGEAEAVLQGIIDGTVDPGYNRVGHGWVEEPEAEAG